MFDFDSFHGVLYREELALSFAYGFSECLDHFKGIHVSVGACPINARGQDTLTQRRRTCRHKNLERKPSPCSSPDSRAAFPVPAMTSKTFLPSQDFSFQRFWSKPFSHVLSLKY